MTARLKREHDERDAIELQILAKTRQKAAQREHEERLVEESQREMAAARARQEEHELRQRREEKHKETSRLMHEMKHVSRGKPPSAYDQETLRRQDDAEDAGLKAHESQAHVTSLKELWRRKELVQAGSCRDPLEGVPRAYQQKGRRWSEAVDGVAEDWASGMGISCIEVGKELVGSNLGIRGGWYEKEEKSFGLLPDTPGHTPRADLEEFLRTPLDGGGGTMEEVLSTVRHEESEVPSGLARSAFHGLQPGLGRSTTSAFGALDNDHDDGVMTEWEASAESSRSSISIVEQPLGSVSRPGRAYTARSWRFDLKQGVLKGELDSELHGLQDVIGQAAADIKLKHLTRPLPVRY